MAGLVQSLYFSGARDSLGNPVASGTAEFFLPGSTSTHVTAYEQSAATSSYTQPVALNAAGKCEVYLKESAQILIRDSEGVAVTVISSDATNSHNLVPDAVVEVTSAYWSGPGGGASPLSSILTRIGQSLGYDGYYKEDPDNVNATARYQSDILRGMVRSKDYGALGDNSNDDTTGLQTAINRAVASGKPLYIEPGTYKISTMLTASGRLTLFGDSPLHAVIRTDESVGILSISSAGESVVIRGVSLLAQIVATTGATALTVSAAGSLIIDNVTAHGRIGIDCSAVTGARLYNCTVSSISE